MKLTSRLKQPTYSNSNSRTSMINDGMKSTPSVWMSVGKNMKVRLAPRPSCSKIINLNWVSIYFTVVSCSPPIADLDKLVKWLNDSRDFYAFLKAMRKAFSDYAKTLPRLR